ncbi:MAG: extracellular solute-binding protein [Oscillospiraceae bacterium]|nr:extracellular solute-binding protein [Oscillospiraceae bacterium]
MIKNYKFIILTAAALIFLLFFLISCSEAEPGSAENDNSGIVPDALEPEPEKQTEPFPEPDVPEADYGGTAFNVLYPFWGAFETQLFGDPETSYATEMDDAIWRRNTKIEGQLNISFNPIVRGERGNDAIKEMLTLVRQSVMAGDGAYDLVFIHPMADLGTFAQGQLLRDWNKMPHVDLSKPYWNQSLKDTLEINGILLYASNDVIIPSPSVMYFNKELVRDYNLPDPYDYVRDGSWTWDKFSEMAKQVTRDLNGDGIFDENDLYGFSILLDGSPMISMMHACDQYITRFDEEGMPVIDIMSEKLVSLIDMIYDLVWTGNQTFTWTTDIWSEGPVRELHENFFPKGHALFTPGSPSHGASEQYRAMEVDFGILPYPKYTGTQEKYISLNHAGLMVIPQDTKNPEMAGIVTELLGAESLRYTIPAYFDILLTHKGVRDDDSLEMMEIIFGNIVYDFGYNFSNFTNIAYIVPRLIAQQSTNIASFYESNAPSVQRDLDAAFRNIMEYEGLDY